MARKTRFVWLYSSLLLLQVPLQPQAHAGPVMLSLEKSVDIALHNSTTVLKSENDVEFSGERVLQSYAQFLPTLDISSQYGHQLGTLNYVLVAPELVQTHDIHVQYQVSTSLNLFNGFFDYDSFKSARQKQNASQLTLVRAKQQIATDITQSYYQVILDRQLLAISKWNAEASKARADLLSQESSVGSVSLADAAQQQAQSDLDQASVITSQTKLHDDLLLLVQKLRVDPKETYELEEPDLSVSSDKMKSSEVDSIQTALKTRADVQAAEQAASAADWDAKAARSDYYPKLNLDFSLLGTGDTLLRQTLSGADSLPPQQNAMWSQLGNQISYTVQLTLTWNLFDRGLTRLNVAQNQVTANNLEIDDEDQKIQSVTQIRQAYGDFYSAQKQLEAAATAATAAHKSYDVVQGRYRVGASSFVDLLLAQSTYVTAQSNEAQARVNFKFQSKLLEFYKGDTPIQ
jgi:outer membrane protein